MDAFRQSSGRFPSVTAIPTRSTSRRLLVSTVGGDADATQYFSIETRLELKSRLTKLQRQLRQLLVQTKLAWMRCFADPRTRAAGAAAAQMVQLGEELMSTLSQAFDLAAGVTTAPLPEYQALVTQVEGKMNAFQQLVNSMAQGDYPSLADQNEEDDNNVSEGGEAEDENDEAKNNDIPTYLHRPMAIDLPSMQTYCKHVAPPYSSYLPANTTKKNASAVKKHLM
ncbi:hypothetical protein PHYBOEH_007766 [Phytophthora boehmeriae]|uniref:Uncharacterized protein n=1 Tax=Phytophthora boehmeriae TaxID=109152 RepID=A0A8T1W5M9_9STRA|nr:hypothetical protein PHYBOEH_007766 [Phytophthora boehmeriae]